MSQLHTLEDRLLHRFGDPLRYQTELGHWIEVVSESRYLTNTGILSISPRSNLTVFAFLTNNALHKGVGTWQSVLEYEAFGIKLLSLPDVGEEPSIGVGPSVLRIHHGTDIGLLDVELLRFRLLLEGF